MKNVLTNKKVIIITLIIITLLTGLVLLTGKGGIQPPKIITSVPAVGSATGDVFKPIIVQFDVAVLSSDFSVSSSPEEAWTIKQESRDTISLVHKQILHPATLYTINLVWQQKPLLPLSFTTQAAQGDPRLVQELTDELNRDYPLARFTPYETPLYRVVYSAPMTFEITLINLNLTSQEAIDEIKEWVASKGGDVDAHKYIMSRP